MGRTLTWLVPTPWLFQECLLSLTCKIDDKVQPSVTVKNWQQRRLLAQLGAVWGSAVALGFVRLS